MKVIDINTLLLEDDHFDPIKVYITEEFVVFDMQAAFNTFGLKNHDAIRERFFPDAKKMKDILEQHYERTMLLPTSDQSEDVYESLNDVYVLSKEEFMQVPKAAKTIRIEWMEKIVKKM